MKDKPIKKAYECHTHWDEQWYLHQGEMVYAETASKARYQFKLDCELTDEDEWWLSRVRRRPAYDLFAPVHHPACKELTDEQLHIIAHANGNNSHSPGYRDYYCCDESCDDMRILIEQGIFGGPLRAATLHQGEAYYRLTSLGKKIASSLLPRTRSQLVRTAA